MCGDRSAGRVGGRARGKKEEGTPLPEADDLWDLVTIQLLHTEHPVAQPEAKTGWKLLPILGAVAVVLLIVVVFVLRRRASPSGA